MSGGGVEEILIKQREGEVDSSYKSYLNLLRQHRSCSSTGVETYTRVLYVCVRASVREVDLD